MWLVKVVYIGKAGQFDWLFGYEYMEAELKAGHCITKYIIQNVKRRFMR